jgi:hypothetical protein
MSAYALHLQGDCNPWACPVCDAECDVCGSWLPECTCPTLPLDEESA